MLSEKQVEWIRKQLTDKTAYARETLYLEAAELCRTCLALFTLIEDVKETLDIIKPEMQQQTIERLIQDWEGKVNA